MSLTQKIDLLISCSHADNVKHGSRTLAQHLRGCAQTAILVGAKERVVLACAAHSLHGTSSFPGTSASVEQVRAIIGTEAAILVGLFSRLPRARRWWLGQPLLGYTAEQWADLALMDVINLAEQM
jgi:hypothetical protein